MFYLHSSDALIKLASYSQTEQLKNESIRLKTQIETLRHDVMFLANIPPVYGIIRAQRNNGIDPVDGSSMKRWKIHLKEIFVGFLQSKKNYFQVRFIGIQDNGKELVRVERDGEKIIKVSEPLLQEKGDRKYFKETIKLKHGQVYLSDVNLNREYGKVTIPYKPVMRAAIPVFAAKNTLFGFIIINMDFAPILNSLSKTTEEIGSTYVINNAGDLLAGPVGAKLFAFEFGNPWKIYNKYPEFSNIYASNSKALNSWELLLPDNDFIAQGQNIFFDPNQPEQFIAIISLSSYSLLLHKPIKTLQGIIVITVFLIIIAAGLAFFISRLITRPLTIITSAADTFAQGKTPTKLPIKKQGEIGILSHAFQNMMQQVNERSLQIQQRESYIHKIVDNIVDGLITINQKGAICSFSRAAEKIFGYQSSEVIGKSINMLMPVSERTSHSDYVRSYAHTGESTVMGKDRELNGLHKNGSLVPIDITLTQMEIDGEPTVIGVVRDISSRKESDAAAHLAAKVMDTTLESIMVSNSDNIITFVNKALLKVTGYSPEELIGQNPRIFKSGKHEQTFYQQMWNSILKTGTWQGEIWDKRKNGEIYPKWMTISCIKNSHGDITNFVSVFSDITERKMVEDNLESLAHFDPLTALPNRLYSLDRLAQLLKVAQREDTKIAVLFLDLDDFKKINDTLGHETGDKLLVEAAQRLLNVVRNSDTVGRLGGDEFIILIDNLVDAEDVLPVVEKLIRQFKEAFKIDERELILSASVGIAVFPEDGADASELLRNADSAMYNAKENGRNCYSFFTENMNFKVSRRLALEEQMHGALERDEFYILYQPQIDIYSGSFIGVEALVRWENNVLGQVFPDEFIHIAEQTGLIIPLGQFILRKALEQTTIWQQDYNSNFRIAVNLSPVQFRDPNMVVFIEENLVRFGISADSLELEITEGVLMSGHSHIIDTLEDLSSLGVEIAMDDFGTGYSSLSYLRSYPFNVLKIDRSFVKDICVSSADRELVNATITMGHALELKVIAEGVETKAQLEHLKAQGCDFAQGYLFSKPVSSEKIEDMLKQQSLVH